MATDLFTKLCRKCKAEKPLEEFPRDSGRDDGFYLWCKACRAASWEKRKALANAKRRDKWRDNAEQFRAKQRAHVDANRERYRGYWRRAFHEGTKRQRMTEWRKNNPDKIRSQNKKQWAKDPEKWKARCRAYYAANRDALLPKQREYYRKNKIRFTKYRHAREKRVAELPWDIRETDIKFALKWWKNCCPVCRASLAKSAVNLDHWIPLSSDTCPGTIPANILPLCESCNKSKHDRDGRRWLEHRLGAERSVIAESQVQAFFAATRKMV